MHVTIIVHLPDKKGQSPRGEELSVESQAPNEQIVEVLVNGNFLDS